MHSIRSAASRLLFALVAFAAFGLAQLALPASALADELDEKFKEGVRKFHAHDFEGAVRAFESVMNSDPSREKVIYWMKNSGVRLLMDLRANQDVNATNHDKLKNFAMWLLYRTVDIQKIVAPDPALVRATVERAIEGDNWKDRVDATNRLADKIGEVAVQLLAQYLHNTNETYRARAVYTLTMMSAPVVHAVGEVMNSPSTLDRQNAAIILGNIGVQFSIPVLLRAANYDADPLVVSRAQQALKKIEGAGNMTDTSAAYLTAAEELWNRESSILSAFDDTWYVWKWKNTSDSEGALFFQQVPRWSYPERLAEQLCHQALAIDPANKKLWGLLICINLRQYREAEAVSNAPDLDEEAREFLAPFVDRAYNGKVLGYPAGEDELYEALNRCLQEQNSALSDVATAVIEALENVASIASLTPGTGALRADPLVRALDSNHKMVKYAAARALISRGWNVGIGGFPQQDNATQILIKALGETGTRSVLCISENTDVLNKLRSQLEALHLNSAVERSRVYGLKRAMEFPAYDLFILDYKIAAYATATVAFAPGMFREESITRYETVLDTLQKDNRTKNTPVIILCMGDDDEQAARDAFEGKNIAEFVTVTNSGQLDIDTYKEKLASIFEAAADDKSRAIQLSVSAAHTIGAIDPGNTTLGPQNMRAFADSLVANTSKRHDDVRIASLDALYNLMDRQCPHYDAAYVAKLVGGVVDVLREPDEPMDHSAVKAHAARALGAIFRTYGASVVGSDRGQTLAEDIRVLLANADTFPWKDASRKRLQNVTSAPAICVLLERMIHHNKDVRLWVGIALGRLALTDDEQRAAYTILQITNFDDAGFLAGEGEEGGGDEDGGDEDEDGLGDW